MGLSRRSERLWIRAWLGVCALVAVAFVWGVGMGGADPLLEDLDDHWPRRLDVGEALLEEGREEEAAAYLKTLEKRFPAKFIRHKFHRERERLLALLGRAQADLGRKSEALDTFRELVDYDERNWCNWELLALTYVSFGELELAHETFERLLEIHPNHLPTVTHLILADAKAGRSAEVVRRYEAYLDAFLLARLDLTGDGIEEPLLLPADGRPHAIDLPAALAEGVTALQLALNGWSAGIGPLTCSGPLTVGETTPRSRVTATPAWTAQIATLDRAATWSAAGPEALLSALLEPGTTPAPTTRLAFELTVYKSVDAELWTQVEACYESLGDSERHARARARTVVGGCPEAGTLFEE